jgi:type IV pilus assembly protein PilY1
MNRYFYSHAADHCFLSAALLAGLILTPPALAASVSLATAPLATSTTSSVKPNVLLVLDNSGSMDWDHMPDDAGDGGSAVSFRFGYYGLRSSQCNQVYYDPTLTYLPPVDETGTSFANASFTSAYTNGFNTGAGTVNLNTSFRASTSMDGDGTGQPAYYYHYSGTQATQAQKNYNSTTSTFYNECYSALNASPGKDVFTRITLSSTAAATTAMIAVSGTASTTVSSIKIDGVELMSGPSIASTNSNTVANNIASNITLNGFGASSGGTSIVTITGVPDTARTITITQSGTMSLAGTIILKADAATLTNFANWYSFYRKRMLMMKTAAGRAFSALTDKYRVGLFKYSSSTPVVNMDTFEGTHRTNWYTEFYAITPSGSTPTRTALSRAGSYYAGKLAVTDPVQYSCQQNFTILSTDGYWNTGDGFKIDGSTMDNQDGTAGRPMYDGAHSITIWTNTYTRDDYSKVSTGCSGGKRRLKTQPQIGSCTVTVSGAVCSPASWSNNGSATISGTCLSSFSLPSPDPSTPVLQSSVESTGSSGGSSNSLADVAMHYYQTDLRTAALGNCTGSLGVTVDVCANNVFTSSTDNNTQQHMTTFTLGLGASGWMNYSSSYLTDISGDYVAVKLGSTADSTAVPPVCPWQANDTVCNWPLPGMDGSGNGFIANVDDLWHAAVNGRGAYFSATNPSTLSTGLSNALAGINSRQGSAAAAATSTLNPVAGNNYAYVASYTTVKWKGNLEARSINVDTGEVSENATWCVENVTAGTCTAPGSIVLDTSGAANAYFCVIPNSIICADGVLDGTDCKIPVATACTGTMNALVADTSDSRTIYTANGGGTALIPFNTAYRAANPQYFDAAHISTLSQWASLDAPQQAAAEGDNLINYLRGQHGFEDRTTNAVANRLYRYREAVMGDALESQPTFISKPLFSYPYPGYSEYKTAQATRAGTVYMGTNDGMLHAFAADTGIERWAYVPSMVIPNMWKLADADYGNLHTNFVNGSPATSDICVSNCTDSATAVWKTILVAGLNGGGRGYYALDITNPVAPALLWEFTPASGIGAVKDDDVGYGFGMPVITRKIDGTWVVLVASGYNNTAGSGTGKEFLFVLDARTGAILSKIGTGVGSIATPGGLAKLGAWNGEPGGNVATYVYGGDLLGNVWRFDINSNVAATTADGEIGTGDVMKFAELYSDAGGTMPQPITTTPILAQILGKRVVIIGTGKYLETADLTTTQTQSYYAIKDDGETATLVNPRTTLVQQTLVSDPATATRSSTGNAPSWGSDRGCFADFPDSGERENIDSRLVQGIVLVPTLVPSNTACSPGGYGWLNFFDYQTCKATGVKSDATIVGVNVSYISGNPVVSWVTDSHITPEQVSTPPFYGGPAGFTGKRVIWRELIP